MMIDLADLPLVVVQGKRQALDYGLLRRMAHSPLHNYVIPGLTSWLIGAPSEQGCVRMFQCDRQHYESISPHSHRFDFECLVLQGEVINHIWTPSTVPAMGDEYVASELIYTGAPGEYEKVVGARDRWVSNAACYREGEVYGMKASEVHSIQFSAGARVLFFEGPPVSDRSVVLEPFCNGERVPTFETRPWMFRRG